MASQHYKQLSVLTLSTTAFTLCFAVWVMFAIIGIPIKAELGLTETQFGLLASTPVLTGALSRLPLGMLTDRYGGRLVFTVLLLSTVVPIWLISEATAYWHFLVLGLFVGLAGGSFAVGIAYTARWFSKARQGLAMGIFGAGNAGAAITKFVAPSLVVAFGWQMVPRVYAVAMLVMAVVFWLFTFTDKSHQLSANVSLKQQLAPLKDARVWRYCQYYSIVFGGYVALSLWLTKYYISEYGLSIQTAALIATVFILPSGVIRALGGWLSDRFGAHSVTWWVMWTAWICLFLLSYPRTDMTVQTVDGTAEFALGLNVWAFTALLFVVGIAWGFGKASVFKYIANDFPNDIGVVSGIVGLFGGLGGFLLPVLFGVLLDVTGINSSIFMLLYGVTCVSLLWMYFAEVRRSDYFTRSVSGIEAGKDSVPAPITDR
ncbi:MFS transporter [Modicisalibacter xianhensis]|uniref:MFS transporter, NNP family, nitrate/nitrite transporter n=1 Tax=Modicisalibacter xianhensis TaxID=442341 RepID=A0A1I3DN06_9GAMM|nr:nitrate/nitrite transporter [Halomonas xianhensis]SFH88112.1 MFS transporter, NNP family, nitrate/nitrite transporter [Halomonas xianhensis]